MCTDVLLGCYFCSVRICVFLHSQLPVGSIAGLLFWSVLVLLWKCHDGLVMHTMIFCVYCRQVHLS